MKIGYSVQSALGFAPYNQAEYESKIEDSVQPIENPFENQQGQVLSVESRTTQRKKGKPRSKRFKSSEEHTDPEVKAAIKQGLDVKILYDSSSH